MNVRCCRAPRLLPLCLATALALGSAGAAAGHGPSTVSSFQEPADRGDDFDRSISAWITRVQRPVPAITGTSIVVANCNDAGTGSYRQAVTDAVSGDTIDLTQTGCSTITLSSGDVVATVADLTLQGPGAQLLTLSGNDVGRVIQHTGTGTLTVRNLSLVHGSAYLALAQTGNVGGGCVYSSGVVVIDSSVVDQCAAINFDRGTVVKGGAVLAQRGGQLTASVISRSSAAAERTFEYGGGLYAAGPLFIFSTLVSGNHLTPNNGYGYGGGVQAGGYSPGYAPPVTIADSTFEANAAFTGGGLHSRGYVSITSSTFDGNTAGAFGGALYVGGNSSSEDPPIAVIDNSTIFANDARFGGGAYVSGRAKISNSTIASNTSHNDPAVGSGVRAPYLDLQSSIVSGNTNDRGTGAQPDDIGGLNDSFEPMTGANNLVGFASVQLPADTIVGVDPLLLPLADNGGPTQTMALDASSPAIDAGNNAGSFVFDQRGLPRTVGNATDIGAVEVGPSDLLFADGFDGAGAP